MVRTARLLLAAPLAAALLMAGPLQAQEGTPDATTTDEAATPAKSRKPGPPRSRPQQPAPRPVAQTAPARTVQAQATVPAASAAGTLPNGASSITEIYGDWTVACGLESGAKLCVASQAQGNKESGQRMFGIELRPPRDGRTEGTILMPFNLKFDAGAILKLDDKELGQGARFSTCIPQGCLLSISFPTAATDAMRTGKTLTVAALNVGSGQAVSFNVSLTGFAAALQRLAALGG